MGRSLLKTIFDLGFFPESDKPEKQLLLGPKRLSPKQTMWDIICWLLTALGIFLRQGLDLSDFSWDYNRLTGTSFAASLVISFALFPTLMRRLNRKRTRPGLEHLAAPFAFGFFLDLVKVTASKLAVRVFS